MPNMVLCARQNGNTRKIYDAIAGLPGWECAQVSALSNLDLSSYGAVILGSGVYGGCPHAALVSFIRNLTPGRAPKRVHVVLTWLGRGTSDRVAFGILEKECSLKGIAVVPDYQKALGQSFGIIHMGHPTGREISSCVEWAKGLKD